MRLTVSFRGPGRCLPKGRASSSMRSFDHHIHGPFVRPALRYRRPKTDVLRTHQGHRCIQGENIWPLLARRRRGATTQDRRFIRQPGFHGGISAIVRWSILCLSWTIQDFIKSSRGSGVWLIWTLFSGLVDGCGGVPADSLCVLDLKIVIDTQYLVGAIPAWRWRPPV